MFVGAHFSERVEFSLDFHRSEFGDVWRTVGCQLGTERVQSANNRTRNCKQIRTFRYGASDQNSASATAQTCQLVLGGITILNHVIAACDKIFPGVRLRGFHSGSMPCVPFGASAPDVCSCMPQTMFESRQQRRGIVWFIHDAVGSVSF